MHIHTYVVFVYAHALGISRPRKCVHKKTNSPKAGDVTRGDATRGDATRGDATQATLRGASLCTAAGRAGPAILGDTYECDERVRHVIRSSVTLDDRLSLTEGRRAGSPRSVLYVAVPDDDVFDLF